MVLVAVWLAITFRTVRITAWLARPRLVWLGAIVVLVAVWLAITFRATRPVAPRRRDVRLRRCVRWAVLIVPPAEGLGILQAEFDFLSRLVEETARLS
ncbi:MAG: hypothetical protein Kow0063_26970 [Anaerolineae bacterium]